MRLFIGEPVTRKENNKILAKITKMLTAKKIEKLQEESPGNQLRTLVKYGLLYQNEAGEWRIADNEHTARIPSGLYTYVCTELGAIRIEPLVRGETKHLVLSNYAEKVRYAGWISFKNDGSGEMVYWNNDSGGYKPNPHLCHQAKLPLELFQNEATSLCGSEGDAKVFCLEKHKKSIPVYTIMNAYKSYKARAQADTYQALRHKVRMEIVANHAEPTEDEMPKQDIAVPST